MKIHLTTTAKPNSQNPYILRNYEWLLKASQHDETNRNLVIDSVEDADIILFTSPRRIFHSDIIQSEIYQKYSEKCLVFDTFDYTIPRVPGIYTSIPKHLCASPIYRPGFYLKVLSDDDKVIGTIIDFSQCQYLFSFVGNAQNWPTVRNEIMALKHPQALLVDTAKGQISFGKYTESLCESKFALCPRGVGPSSQRIFEAMRVGRVPIIISDDWMPPGELDWNEFSIRVHESKIQEIPELLEGLETKAEQMGARAREVYHAYFSLQSGFDWIVKTCLAIKEQMPRYHSTVSRNVLVEAASEAFKNPDRAHRRQRVSGLLSLSKELLRAKLGKL